MKEIPIEQVQARLRGENPWWESPPAGPFIFGELKPRPYLNLFYPLATDRKVRRAVVLLGPRRVGKTVLIHHAIQKLIQDGVAPSRICYASIDHPLYNGLSLDDFLDAHRKITGVDASKKECFCFFDEIQYLRDWEIHLKALVDHSPRVKCIASGSAAAALRLKSHESGAGRFTDFLLPPLTFYEYLVLLGKGDLVSVRTDGDGFGSQFSTADLPRLNEHFVNYLNYGGYPEMALSPDVQRDPGRFVKSDIIDKVLLRDLPSLYGISDVQELNSLFTTLAYNTAGEVSLDALSKGSGVAKNTIKRYMEYLEAAFLIRIVHRVDRSARRFRKANFFKVYLTNPSMRTALFAPVSAQDEAMGAMVETAIFSQWFHSNYPLYYARWHGGEVDIVHLRPDQKPGWALEVKWSDRFADHPEELKSLLKFCHEHNLAKAGVTTQTQTRTTAKDSVTLEFTPAALYCFLLGYTIFRAKHLLSEQSDRNRDTVEP
jgi:hypothetical protein